jgi:hypothetical protein
MHLHSEKSLAIFRLCRESNGFRFFVATVAICSQTEAMFG